MKPVLDITNYTKIRMSDGKAYCMFESKLIAVADLMETFHVIDKNQPEGRPRPGSCTTPYEAMPPPSSEP